MTAAPPRPWRVPEDDEWLTRLRAEGHGFRACAQLMSRDRAFLGEKAKALGLPNVAAARANGVVERPWTDAEITRLHELVAEGRSAAQCGEALGRSKNSAQWRIRKQGLVTAYQPGAAPRAPASRDKHNRQPPTNPVPVALAPRVRVTAGPERGQCCWPEGNPGEAGFHFCKVRAVPGRTYCGRHCAQAYVGRAA